MRIRLRPALVLSLLVGCGSDPKKEVPSTEVAGDGGSAASDEGGAEGEGEAEGEAPVECELRQVLQDGRCLDRCGTNGPVCDPDGELCVVNNDGVRGCYGKCGRDGDTCEVGELCFILRGDDDVEGFCDEGTCPDGSHPGTEGWCVCDSPDPPPDLPCDPQLCGPANKSGICEDAVQICVDGVCR